MWQKNKEILPEDGQFIISPDSNKLQIFQVDSDDAGPYTCTATNSLGSAEATIMVVVKGELVPKHSVVGGAISCNTIFALFAGCIQTLTRMLKQ